MKLVASNETFDFHECVQQYREYRQNEQTILSLHGSHAAFVGQEGQGSQPTLNFRTKDGKRICLCGKVHEFEKCYYILEDLRPKL